MSNLIPTNKREFSTHLGLRWSTDSDESDGGAGCLMLTDLPKELNLLHEAKVGEMSAGLYIYIYKMSIENIEMYDMFSKKRWDMVGNMCIIYTVYICMYC